MNTERPMDDFVTDRPITDSSILFYPDASSASEQSGIHACHDLECELRPALLAHPDLHFTELTVRRVPGGICLEGTLVVDRDSPDICEIVRDIAEVEIVMNRLKVMRNYSLPPKG